MWQIAYEFLFPFHSNDGDILIVSFARYNDLLVENPEIFIPDLYLAPRRKFVKMFDASKTRMIGPPYGEKNYDDMLCLAVFIQYRDVTTVRRTDGQNCYIKSISRVSKIVECTISSEQNVSKT